MTRRNTPRSPWALVCLILAVVLLLVGLTVALTARADPLAPTEVDAGCIGAGPAVVITPFPPGYATPTPQPHGPYVVYLPRFVQGGYPDLWCPYKVASPTP